jgi:hypothetical protein
MVHFPFSLDRIQCPAIQFAVAGALAFPAILFSPLVAQANEFGNCTGKLLAAGIDTDSAALACAQALHPDQVASCVVDVTNTAEVVPEDALAACSRDRRPDEVAACFGSIYTNLEGADPLETLENCQLSILPIRYSDCVTGLAAESDLTPEASLATCSVAGYRPVDLAPTFILSD